MSVCPHCGKSTKGKLIREADRCQVGKYSNGKYQVWHKVLDAEQGKTNTRPLMVSRDKVAVTVDDLLARARKRGLIK